MHTFRLSTLRLRELRRDHHQAEVDHEERTDLTASQPTSRPIVRHRHQMNNISTNQSINQSINKQ